MQPRMVEALSLGVVTVIDSLPSRSLDRRKPGNEETRYKGKKIERRKFSHWNSDVFGWGQRWKLPTLLGGIRFSSGDVVCPFDLCMSPRFVVVFVRSDTFSLSISGFKSLVFDKDSEVWSLIIPCIHILTTASLKKFMICSSIDFSQSFPYCSFLLCLLWLLSVARILFPYYALTIFLYSFHLNWGWFEFGVWYGRLRTPYTLLVGPNQYQLKPRIQV